MSIISSVINDIDNVTNESTMSTLCAMAESYDKMQMITESCDRTCDLSEFSVFQEAKQQQEGFFRRIINLIKELFTAIFNRITGKKNPTNNKEILDNIKKAKNADRSKRAAIFGALLGAAGGAAAGAVGTKIVDNRKQNTANEKITKEQEAREAEFVEKITKLNEELSQLKKMNDQHDIDKKSWESEKAKYEEKIRSIDLARSADAFISKKREQALNSLVKTITDVYGPDHMTDIVKEMKNNGNMEGIGHLAGIVKKYNEEFKKKQEEINKKAVRAKLKFTVRKPWYGLITYDPDKDEVQCNFYFEDVRDLYDSVTESLETGIAILESMINKSQMPVIDVSEIEKGIISQLDVKKDVANDKRYPIDIESVVINLNKWIKTDKIKDQINRYNELSGKITDEIINETMKSHPDAVKYFTKLNSDLPFLSGILQGYFDIINMAVQEYNEIIVKSGLISNRTTTVGNITENVKIDKNKKINSNTPPKQEKADNAGDDPLSKAKAEYKKAVEDFVNKHGKKPTRKKAQQMSSEIIKKYGLESGTVIWESVEEFIDDEDEVVRDSSTSWYY